MKNQKLKELEKLYGKFSVRVLCEALDVSRGTFYNHILRNKKENTSYVKRRQVLSNEILKIYEDSRGLFGSDKILAVLKTKSNRLSIRQAIFLFQILLSRISQIR